MVKAGFDSIMTSLGLTSDGAITFASTLTTIIGQLLLTRLAFYAVGIAMNFIPGVGALRGLQLLIALIPVLIGLFSHFYQKIVDWVELLSFGKND